MYQHTLAEIQVGCLRREYFEKDEVGKTPWPLDLGRPGKGAFTLHGHRLSSLYRMSTIGADRLRLRLKNRISASPFIKYSNSELFPRALKEVFENDH